LSVSINTVLRVESETERASVQLQVEDSAEPSVAQDSAPEEAFWRLPDGFALDIARATRTWIQYGMVGFAVMCIVIGAVKGALGLLK
jgi:hypothetical protein